MVGGGCDGSWMVMVMVVMIVVGVIVVTCSQCNHGVKGREVRQSGHCLGHKICDCPFSN